MTPLYFRYLGGRGPCGTRFAGTWLTRTDRRVGTESMSETVVSHRARFARPPTARARVRRLLAFVLALGLAAAGVAGPAAAGSQTSSFQATPVAAVAASPAPDDRFDLRRLSDSDLQAERGTGADEWVPTLSETKDDLAIILWDEWPGKARTGSSGVVTGSGDGFFASSTGDRP